MYNANKPNPDELPTSAQLFRSTIIALVSAVVILVTIVLPAEYGIDPTRIGRVLGLAEMGNIKTQLAEEAEVDRQKKQHFQDDRSSIVDDILEAIVPTAHAETADGESTDTMSITLTPGEGAEIKLLMEENAVAEYRWVAEGGVLNYDLHGDGSGKEISYRRARAVPGDEGTVTAAFTGNHGWFWRNRDKQDVTVTLFVRGEYSGIKRTY
jgi:hypothetical protein